jgi:hypothetical protein
MTRKDDIAAAEAALARPFDPAGATVVERSAGRRPTVVHSTRLPTEYSEELEAEAARLGTNPSKLMQDIVVRWLSARRQAPTVTVNVADLHRALDSVLGHQPAA